MTTDIRSRDDLPFIARDADGALIPWHPRHELDTPEDAFRYGLACVDAIAQLARVDAAQAHEAAKQAVLSPHWNSECGEERGFVEGLARAAIVSWCTMTQRDGGALSISVDQQDAQWLALNSRLAAMEAQIRALSADS